MIARAAILALPLVLGAALSGCSYGTAIDMAPANSPGHPTRANFRELAFGVCPFFGANASATVIASGLLATNEHAAALLPHNYRYSTHMDIAFAPIKGGKPLPFGKARNGEHVWIYGSGCGGGERFAEGTVIIANAKHCWGKPDGHPVDAVDRYCANVGYGTAPGFMLAAPAGDGFSGGPVVNDAGQLIGIFQGVISQPVGGLAKGTYGFAYHIQDVELAAWPLVADGGVR